MIDGRAGASYPLSPNAGAECTPSISNPVALFSACQSMMSINDWLDPKQLRMKKRGRYRDSSDEPPPNMAPELAMDTEAIAKASGRGSM